MSYLEKIEKFKNNLEKEFIYELNKLDVNEFKIDTDNYIYYEFGHNSYKVTSITKSSNNIWTAHLRYQHSVYFQDLSIENQAKIIDLIKL